jgi:hypothetical protein
VPVDESPDPFALHYLRADADDVHER